MSSAAGDKADSMQLALAPELESLLNGEETISVGLFGNSKRELAYRGYRRCYIPYEEIFITEGKVNGQAIVVCDSKIDFPPPERDRRYGTPKPKWPPVCGFMVWSKPSGGYLVWRRWLPEPMAPDKGMALQASFVIGLTAIGGRLAVVGVGDEDD